MLSIGKSGAGLDSSEYFLFEVGIPTLIEVQVDVLDERTPTPPLPADVLGEVRCLRLGLRGDGAVLLQLVVESSVAAPFEEVLVIQQVGLAVACLPP